MLKRKTRAADGCYWKFVYSGQNCSVFGCDCC